MKRSLILPLSGPSFFPVFFFVDHQANVDRGKVDPSVDWRQAAERRLGTGSESLAVIRQHLPACRSGFSPSSPGSRQKQAFAS